MKRMIKNGFTLIELLVVISVIGILVSLAFVSFTQSQKQARDVQRKSDLAQYRTALEAFANANNGLFPYYDAVAVGARPMDEVCNAALTHYAASCPQDPKYSASRRYGYRSNGSGSLGDPTATKYLIYINAGLEVNTLGAPNGTTWVVCYNGNTGAVGNTWADINVFCPI